MKLPYLEIVCDSYGLNIICILNNTIVSFNSYNTSKYLEGFTDIRISNKNELLLLFCLNSKCLYLENNSYLLIFFFNKLSNKEFVDLYYKFNFDVLVCLFNNLYLGIW